VFMRSVISTPRYASGASQLLIISAQATPD
jgi:hypothetical protein